MFTIWRAGVSSDDDRVLDLRNESPPRSTTSQVLVIEPQMGMVPQQRLEPSVSVVTVARAVGDPDWFVKALRRSKASLVLWKDSIDHLELAMQAECAQRQVELLVLARPTYGLMSPREVHRLGGLPWIRLGKPTSRRSDLYKRFFECLLVVVTVPIWALLILLIACAVGVTGQPIYVQPRVGANGKVFGLIKFRTMVIDAEAESGPIIVAPDDPRITRLGRALRRWRLDELPQLWNVLRGDMSLVGPRPERPEIMAQFDQMLPDYDLRHLIRPGLTGIAQLLLGHSAGAEDKLRWDLIYVATRSWRGDIRILWQTVGHALRGFPNG